MVVTDRIVAKPFVDRLQTAKREKKDLKIKSVDCSTAYNRTYIVVNIRKKYNHKVEIGKSPFCDCEDFMKNSGKEFWKHIIWTLRYLIFVDCRKTVICCSIYICISQFQLRPAPPPPHSPTPPAGLTSGISIFWPWMANSRGWGLLSCQIPRDADEKRGQMPRPPSTLQHFSVIAHRVVPF